MTLKEKLRFTLSALVIAVSLLAANAVVAHAQSDSTKGDGTPGRIAKWVGTVNPSREIGNSVITESNSGQIGIGTTAPTSKLTVAGLIESTLGGYKFPDGTVQTTAGLASVFHDATLAGTGSSASPLGVANGGVGTNQLANNAVTAAKIAPGNVVKSLNGLKDDLSLAAGSGITITPAGNTLTIASSASDPAKTAFQRSFEILTKDDVNFSTATISVPGKRLVIEYLTINVFSSFTEKEVTFRISTTVDGFKAFHHIDLAPITNFGGLIDKVVRIYADGEATLSMEKPGGGFANAFVTVSGHLVDLP